MAQDDDSLRRTPIVRAVEQTSPAVVNISTEKIVQSRGSFGFHDPFFDQFFRDFLDPFPRRQYTQNSLGSGVLIDERGYVLTNYHVILRASRIKVILSDNREFEGELVGADADSDLAVVKITAEEPLPVATMGSSDDLMIGEPVIAIGNPFGLSHTITTGVISALNRSIRVSEDQIFRGFIQTDAPINPGNSGGPLINILGQVIGINTAIYGDAQGIGFAIPIDKAERVVDDLITYGEVRSAWIGINLQDITPKIAQYFDYNASDGVLIAQVFAGSSAEEAGLRQGDILIALDGKPIRDLDNYHALLADYTAENTVTFTLIRDGEPLDIPVTTEEFSVQHAMDMAEQDFGVQVDAITQRLAYKYSLRTAQGVLITEVRENSSAHRVGIEPGDVIRQLDGSTVSDLEDFRDAVMASQGESSLVFLIQRRGRGYYVTLERD